MTPDRGAAADRADAGQPAPRVPGRRGSYGWELKWDGLRAVAYVSGGTVRLVSRNDKEMAGSYPELGVLAERPARR